MMKTDNPNQDSALRKISGNSSILRNADVGHILELRGKLAERDMEISKLRAIFPHILEALESAGGCSADCSIEFMEMIPNEVGLVVHKLKREAADRIKDLSGMVEKIQRELTSALAAVAVLRNNTGNRLPGNPGVK